MLTPFTRVAGAPSSSASMRFTETPLKGNYLIDLDLLQDQRGFFSRLFCKSDFSKLGLNTDWVQINNSSSAQVGTLRGIHFQQAPYSEVKLVRCVRGAIWDVVVDLRPHSQTFGNWFAATLSDSNRTMMYVPENFGHGFLSLEPDSELIYFVSKPYCPDYERSLLWNDPLVSIDWPFAPSVVSPKDQSALSLAQLFPH